MSSSVPALPESAINKIEHDPGRRLRFIHYEDAPRPVRSKFTPQRQKVIVESLEKHAPVTSAAEAAGVNPGTFYDWIRRGQLLEQEKLKQGKELNELEIEYVKFYRDVRKARVEAEMDLLEVVTGAALEDGDWRAALKILKALHPEKYSQTQIESPQTQGQQQDVSITLNIGDKTPERREIDDIEAEIVEEVGEDSGNVLGEERDED